MTLSNCRRCGALYQRISSDICQKCYQEEEQQIQKIREFQRKHPSATIMDILKNIDVDHSLLEKWIEENRLHLEDHPESTCRECGQVVPDGEKLCRACMYKKISSSPKDHFPDTRNGNRGIPAKRPR